MTILLFVFASWEGGALETELHSAVNTIQHGDCIAGLAALPAESVDLVFADPPFNIGYEYDVYDDRRSRREYLDWCGRWIAGVARVLKPSGTFWLAIGDEFAAELKVLAQDNAGFTCRSWVIWYYTFGVNVRRGFSRSHTHLFHFVKDPAHFTFNAENPLVRVLSAQSIGLCGQPRQSQRPATRQYLDPASPGCPTHQLHADGRYLVFRARGRNLQGT